MSVGDRQITAAVQRLVDLGQSLCDVLESIHTHNLQMWDADGGGPAFVITPEDVRKHGGIITLGSFLVDVEGWHRLIDEVAQVLPELRLPHRPRRPESAANEGHAT